MNEGENAMNESPTKPWDETDHLLLAALEVRCTRGHVHFAMNDRRNTTNEGEVSGVCRDIFKSLIFKSRTFKSLIFKSRIFLTGEIL